MWFTIRIRWGKGIELNVRVASVAPEEVLEFPAQASRTEHGKPKVWSRLSRSILGDTVRGIGRCTCSAKKVSQKEELLFAIGSEVIGGRLLC